MRVHRTTHPILGPASWREMVAAVEKLRAEGRRICTWCHRDLPPGRRSRCGNLECSEAIWQAYSWGRCRGISLRTHQICPCGKRSSEVDHIIPVSLGGLGDQCNLRALCRACHKAATNRLRREKAAYVAAEMAGVEA